MKLKILKEEILYQGYMYLKKAKVFVPGFNREGQEKSFEMFGRGDSVASLVYVRDREEFIFVNQYRYPAHQDGGYLLEIVAGGIEGENRQDSIAREIQEEIGFEVNELELISKFYVSPGRTDERLYLFYAEVDSSMKVYEGGGLEEEGEDIEIVYLTEKETLERLERKEFLDAKTIMALQWWKLKNQL